MVEIPQMPRDENGIPSLSGFSFAFFGNFAYWPSHHTKTARQTAKALGGRVVTKVNESLDFLVLGDKRGKGRSEAKTQVQRMIKKAQKESEKNGQAIKHPIILNEADYRDMVRRDISGMTFAFFGEFEYCPPGFDDGRPPALTQAAGGVVQEKVDAGLHFLVLGNRRGKGKTAAKRKAEAIQEAGGLIEILTEDQFLDLVRTEKVDADQLDFPSFISQLRGVVNAKKLTRALKMLKEESYQLYVDVDEQRLVGVVKSQTGYRTLYSPWLDAKGRYGCSTSDLHNCMGLQGNPCKHLLVLLLGLAGSGGMEPATAYQWISQSSGQRPKEDQDLVADTFLRYKGAEAGEVDWRPLETVPEDYYAF